MPCQILVSNKSSIAKAEIILIEKDIHKWGYMESMQEWLDSGNTFESWPRTFSIVKVTDKSKEELQYLLEENQQGLNKYHFIEPAQDTEIFQTLYLAGEYESNWSVVSQYIAERV